MNNEIYFRDSLCAGKYLVDNGFRYELKILLFNKVKRIRIRDIDKGKVTISKIEKWKRELVNRQAYDKIKLKFLHPNVYNSLITFVVVSKFEDRPKYAKIYEDQIYNKVKTKII